MHTTEVVVCSGPSTTQEISTPAPAACSFTKLPKLSWPTRQARAAGAPSLARSMAALDAQPPTWMLEVPTAWSTPGRGRASTGESMTSVVTLPIQRIFFMSRLLLVA